MVPSRNVGVTTPCPVCGLPFTPVGRQRVCSAACRQAAWRRRHATPPPSIPPRAGRAATIYEYPACGTRYLGEQRCPDCGIFCRKLGPGGPCPTATSPSCWRTCCHGWKEVRPHSPDAVGTFGVAGWAQSYSMATPVGTFDGAVGTFGVAKLGTFHVAGWGLFSDA